MALIPESPYIDIKRAASILTSAKQTITDQDVIELILAGHLQCYVRDHDYGGFLDCDTFESGDWAGSTTPELVSEPMRHINPEVKHIWVTFPEMTRIANGKQFTRPAQHCTIEPAEIQLLTAEVRELIARIDAQTVDEQPRKNAAATTFKALQTADVDKQIDAVIQLIDAAVREHIRGRKPERIVNHILFLKEAGLDSKKRARDKVKKFIEKEHSFNGYSAISRRPAAKDGYFVTR